MPEYDSDYSTRRVKLSLSEIVDILSNNVYVYDDFLNLLSEKHCGNDMLMDIEWEDIEFELEVSGDVSEAKGYSDYKENV